MPDSAPPPASATARSASARSSHPQLKPLAVSALGIYSEGEKHPYEVYQLMIKRREDLVVKVTPGTLYHTISRMAENGLLTITGTEREGNRPERTTYRITEAGRAALGDWVERTIGRPVYEYPSLPVALAELSSLQRDRAVAALRDRVAILSNEIERFDEALEWLRNVRRLPEVWWLDHGFQRAVLAAEASWLADLVERLDSGDLDWTPSPHCMVDEATAIAQTPPPASITDRESPMFSSKGRR